MKSVLGSGLISNKSPKTEVRLCRYWGRGSDRKLRALPPAYYTALRRASRQAERAAPQGPRTMWQVPSPSPIASSSAVPSSAAPSDARSPRRAVQTPVDMMRHKAPEAPKQRCKSCTPAQPGERAPSHTPTPRRRSTGKRRIPQSHSRHVRPIVGGCQRQWVREACRRGSRLCAMAHLMRGDRSYRHRKRNGGARSEVVEKAKLPNLEVLVGYLHQCIHGKGRLKVVRVLVVHLCHRCRSCRPGAATSNHIECRLRELPVVL
jgi:hypothetical protein